MPRDLALMLLAVSIARYRAHRHGWSGVLQVGFRLWLAKRLINLAWVAYFYMARGIAASLCLAVRQIAPEAELLERQRE